MLFGHSTCRKPRKSEKYSVCEFFLEATKSKNEAGRQVPEQQISAQELQTAHALAEAVKQGVTDIRQAKANNTHVGRHAEEFLAELEQR